MLGKLECPIFSLKVRSAFPQSLLVPPETNWCYKIKQVKPNNYHNIDSISLVNKIMKIKGLKWTSFHYYNMLNAFNKLVCILRSNMSCCIFQNYMNRNKILFWNRTLNEVRNSQNTFWNTVLVMLCSHPPYRNLFTYVNNYAYELQNSEYSTCSTYYVKFYC